MHPFARNRSKDLSATTHVRLLVQFCQVFLLNPPEFLPFCLSSVRSLVQITVTSLLLMDCSAPLSQPPTVPYPHCKPYDLSLDNIRLCYFQTCKWLLKVKSMYLELAHKALQDKGLLLVSLAPFLTPPLWPML